MTLGKHKKIFADFLLFLVGEDFRYVSSWKFRSLYPAKWLGLLVLAIVIFVTIGFLDTFSALLDHYVLGALFALPFIIFFIFTFLLNMIFLTDNQLPSNAGQNLLVPAIGIRLSLLLFILMAAIPTLTIRLIALSDHLGLWHLNSFGLDSSFWLEDLVAQIRLLYSGEGFLLRCTLSAVLIVLVLLPLLLKTMLLNQEFYINKRSTARRLVLNHYIRAKQKIQQLLYERNRPKIDDPGYRAYHRAFTPARARFVNPPFNTIKKINLSAKKP